MFVKVFPLLLLWLLLCTGCAETGSVREISVPDRETTAEAETEPVQDGIPRLQVQAFVTDPETDTENLTELQLGETYTIHVGGGEDCNLGLRFLCEGYAVGVTAEDYLLELSVGQKDSGPWDSGNAHESRTCGFDVQVTNDGYVSVLPIFCGRGDHVNFPDKTAVWGDYTSVELQKQMSFTGQEFHISLHMYTLNDPDSPILRARLKMIQQDDPWAQNDYTSGLFTISLTEYELSDTYKMMLE